MTEGPLTQMRPSRTSTSVPGTGLPTDTSVRPSCSTCLSGAPRSVNETASEASESP